MFSVNTTPEEFENATITGHFGSICVRDINFGQENIVIKVTSSFFWKASFSKCFLSTLKRKAPFSNPSCLKSLVEKLRFRDGLVWSEGLTGERKLRFLIATA